MISNTITVLPTIEAKDISMKYKDGTRFTAKIYDGESKPYVNQTVLFNINGVLYERVSDGNGVAGLNINLSPGDFVITSMFNGYGIANTISIKVKD